MKSRRNNPIRGLVSDDGIERIPGSGERTRPACLLGRPAQAIRTAPGETRGATRETRALPAAVGRNWRPLVRVVALNFPSDCGNLWNF